MADYTPLTGLTLTATQQAYQIPTAEKVVVDIKTQTIAASVFNSTASAHLAVQVSVWQINDDGTPKLDDKGNRIGPYVRNETILTSALADGTVNLPATLTQMTLDALVRMSNWLVVQPQLAALLNASAS